MARGPAAPFAVLLKRAGLVTSRTRRRTPGHPGRPTAAMDAPNAVWTADVKGEHRTLKAGATRPAAATLAAQQRVFDRFRRESNDERAHEALGQLTPASRYAPSPRPYPARIPPLEYPAHWEVRRVRRNGGIRWYDAWVNVSHVAGRHRLAEESVGFEEIDVGVWNVAFGPLVLGRFDERTLRITAVNGDKSRNPRQV